MDNRPASRPSRDRGTARTAELFTASDLARFCQVDLKTIHNWSDKGQISHFRTPGRHLRFRRLDVLEFLRRYGYSIPDELRSSKPRLLVIESDGTVITAIRRAFARRFEITSFQDPYDALFSLSSLEPDGVIFDLDFDGFDGLRFLARMRAIQQTAHIRGFVYTRHRDVKDRAIAAGASAFVVKDDVAALRETIERHMGIGAER